MEYAIKTLKCEKKFIEETFKDRELAKQKISEIDQALQLLQTDVICQLLSDLTNDEICIVVEQHLKKRMLCINCI